MLFLLVPGKEMFKIHLKSSIVNDDCLECVGNRQIGKPVSKERAAEILEIIQQ